MISQQILRWCSAILVATAMFVLPQLASATVVKVYYNPTGAPACCQDNGQMARVIQQAAREWEQHSFGQVQFDWKGVNVSPPGPANDVIVVYWNAMLSNSTACGDMGQRPRTVE